MTVAYVKYIKTRQHSDDEQQIDKQMDRWTDNREQKYLPDQTNTKVRLVFDFLTYLSKQAHMT